jgi:peptidoglycan L-alanyl-D-glutamate endopeptidase CwlK
MDARSELNLVGVHKDLVKVVRRAYLHQTQGFVVIDGIRTLKEEIAHVKSGASTTTHSRHLDGHAVDVAALDDTGKISWNTKLYAGIAIDMKAAALYCGVPITWGGDWKSFKDYGHFELSWAAYPSEPPEQLKEIKA